METANSQPPTANSQQPIANSPRMIPVCEPTLMGNELEYVTDCVKSNWISSHGKYIEQFESGFAKFCGVKHGVGCFNGTVAIHLALEALGIGKGAEIIVPSFTMIASANACIYAGARPVLVDADKETWTIDVNKIKERITKKTRAIMPVHIYGHPCDMKPIWELAERYNLKVIEDAAEGHGAEYNGKRAGSLSDAAAFSFYANKILTMGEGGAVTTDDDKVADKVRLLRNHAFTPNRFVHEVLGFNYRITNIQAAIGLAQVENADKLVEMRRRNAKLYMDLLSDVDGIVLPAEKRWAKNVYWMFGIVADKFGLSRDEIMVKMRERGVDTRAFFVPMHSQPVFANNWAIDLRFPDVHGHFPVADWLGRNGFYFPSASHLTEEQIRFVVDAFKGLRK